MGLVQVPGLPNDAFRAQHVVTREETVSTVPHHHGFYEFYLYLRGEMTFLVEDRLLPVRRGDLVLIPPFVPHRTSYEKGGIHERILLFIEAPVLDAFFPDGSRAQLQRMVEQTRLTLPEPLCADLVTLLKDRVLPAFDADATSLARRKATLLAMGVLTEVLERFERGELGECPTQVTPQERKVAEAIGFIHAHYMDSLSIEVISRSCFVDKFYLSHLFKRVTGVGVHQYVGRKRLLEAEKMLLDTDDSVTRIAQAVGFGSPRRFIAAFRQRNGCTPSDFRSRRQPALSAEAD